jgi:hypothetical protein
MSNTNKNKLYLVPNPAPNSSSTSTSTKQTTAQPKGRVAVKELEWFFALSEADMGLHSNFMDGLVPERHRENHETTLERRVRACSARRVILERFAAIGRTHAGVLQAAHTTRPWSALLQAELGALTGVAVRLATAEVGLPDDADALETLERRTADRLADTLLHLGGSALRDLRREAAALYHLALRAYERERGDVILPVGRWR